MVTKRAEGWEHGDMKLETAKLLSQMLQKPLLWDLGANALLEKNMGIYSCKVWEPSRLIFFACKLVANFREIWSPI
ncbi:hypothetical protein AMECASPLE_024215 [Ameca splendens]|uniref:Uncharacterized protein n=1 Tax=Ameca splendens TaxID=208324 RepID=A0ABV1A136_9TELE